MLLEHPPGWGLVQGTHIQQVWRRAEGRDIPVSRQQPVLGFVLSTLELTPNAAVSIPTPGLQNLRHPSSSDASGLHLPFSDHFRAEA